MKRLVNLLVTLAVIGGLVYVLWIGAAKQHAKAESISEANAEATAEEEEEKPEEFTVMLDKKRATALAIEKEQPQKLELQARRIAYGSVIDPTPLVTLDGDLAGAEAALAASKAENKRTLALVATNDASKKTAEAAEAQFLADQIKVDGLRRGALLQWGPAFEGDTEKRHAFIQEILSGKSSLVRVDILPGDALVELPKSAKLVVMGREGEALTATEIIPSTATDPKTQAQGYLLVVKEAPFVLRPGMALTSWLELPGKPKQGFAIPRSAILRHDGATWVYAQEEEEKYVRKPIALSAPLDGDQGWFIEENAGLTADDVVVVVGASSMLSEELKAQGAGGEE